VAVHAASCLDAVSWLRPPSRPRAGARRRRRQPLHCAPPCRPEGEGSGHGGGYNALVLWARPARLHLVPIQAACPRASWLGRAVARVLFAERSVSMVHELLDHAAGPPVLVHGQLDQEPGRWTSGTPWSKAADQRGPSPVDVVQGCWTSHARRWRTRSVNAGLTWCFALRRGVWATGSCCRRCAVEAGPCPWSIEVPASGRWSGRSVHSPRTNRVTWSSQQDQRTGWSTSPVHASSGSDGLDHARDTSARPAGRRQGCP
jgi:hypothetical protein